MQDVRTEVNRAVQEVREQIRQDVAAEVGSAPPGTVALTSDQAAALRAQRTDFRNQLQSLEGQRRRISEEIRTAPEPAVPGLVARLKALDEHTIALDGQIMQINQKLLGAPRPTAAETNPPSRPPDPEEMLAIGGAFSMVLLLPIAIAYARRIWRRSAAPAIPAGWNDSMRRFERMEQAVDAVAIEVERISETQRFLTRVMVDRDPQLVSNRSPEREPT